MECDVAAPFEGQPIDAPAVRAVRDELLCVQHAPTCDVVRPCLAL